MSPQERQSSTAFNRLVRDLHAAFPSAAPVDYAGLLGVRPEAKVISPAQLQEFAALTAGIQLMIDAGVLKAERFDDGRHTFFWNVRLTGAQFGVLSDYVASDDSDQRGLLARLSQAAWDASVRR